MSTEWSSFWLDVRNLHWGAVDEVILERIANALGWGPERSLLEFGAGRGLHSKRLYETMRCADPDVHDPCPESHEFMKRAGLNAIMEDAGLKAEYDIVWSNGLVEHFEGDERQTIVAKHFRFSGDWVLLIIPRKNWQRRLFRPRKGVPHQTEYTNEELEERMQNAAVEAWGQPPATLAVDSFCPFFAVRHIPDAWCPVMGKEGRGCCAYSMTSSRAAISLTARSIPTRTARDTTLCPMLNSSISSISAIACTFL